jgi:hypothetical protein
MVESRPDRAVASEENLEATDEVIERMEEWVRSEEGHQAIERSQRDASLNWVEWLKGKG